MCAWRIRVIQQVRRQRLNVISNGMVLLNVSLPERGRVRLLPTRGLIGRAPRERKSTLATLNCAAPSTRPTGSWKVSSTPAACRRRWGRGSRHLSPSPSSSAPRWPVGKRRTGGRYRATRSHAMRQEGTRRVQQRRGGSRFPIPLGSGIRAGESGPGEPHKK